MKQNKQIHVVRLYDQLLRCFSPAGFFHSYLYIWDHPLHIFKGTHVGITNNVVPYQSIGPEGVPNSEAFHLGLHCLPRYKFTFFQFSKN